MPRNTQILENAASLPKKIEEYLTVNQGHQLATAFGCVAQGVITKARNLYVLHPNAESALKSRKPAIVPIELELPSTETDEWKTTGPRMVGYIYNDHLSQRYAAPQHGVLRPPRQDGTRVTTSPITKIVMENGERKSIDATELWLAEGIYKAEGRSSIVAAVHTFNGTPKP